MIDQELAIGVITDRVERLRHETNRLERQIEALLEQLEETRRQQRDCIRTKDALVAAITLITRSAA